MQKYNSFLIIDSVQAGLRTTGYLSIVDYPKLKNTNPPDMEIFSKAISSGQFPLSILAVNKKITNMIKLNLIFPSFIFFICFTFFNFHWFKTIFGTCLIL